MTDLKTVVREHRETACYDHPSMPDYPVWCCACGEHELIMSWRSHVAAAWEREQR